MTHEANLMVEYAATKELVPYAHNAKKHPRKQVQEIASSIATFGFNDPIAIWHNAHGEMEIVEGHGRLLAAEQLGMDSVPTICLDHMTDSERRAYVHVHNQLTMNTDFDAEKLLQEISELSQFDWEGLGFEDYVGATEDDEVEFTDSDMPAYVQTRCQPGDKWVLGEHMLVCGDSTSRETWDLLLQGEQVDLMVTDPPYNVAYVGGTADAMTIANDDLGDGEFRELLNGYMERAAENMKPGAAFYIWHASRTQREFEDSVNHAGMTVRQQIIWNKSSLVLGRQDYQWKHEPCLYGWKDGAGHYFIQDRTQTTVLSDGFDIETASKDELREAIRKLQEHSTVWDFEKPRRSELHPTMKPVPLMGRCVLNSSRRGDIVVDPFGGSGSTLMACEQAGRKCRTIELDPIYCDAILQRWEDETGQQAVRMERL